MEEVQYIYSGTDTRRLLISGNKAVIIAGDGEVTKLKFWFPETHDRYTKEIEWSFWIRDFEDNLINPRYFLTNNEFIIPTDVTYMNSGRQLEFAIIFKDPEDPLFEERSLLSPIYVSKGAKYLEEPPPMSALLELMEKAYITSAYDVDSRTDRPIVTFTSCDGLLYTLLLDMPYLNESGKIPPQFFSNDQVVTVFQIESISELTSLDAKSPDMARITAGIEEGDIYILIGEDSTDIDNWYPIYSQSSLNSKLDDTQLVTSWSQTTSDSNIPSEKLVKTALDTKEPTITGGATSITASNLTASRALISDTNGKVSVSPVTATELGYVDGVTSAIQTQINSKQDTLTFDTTPTASSVNPVTSDGIKTALDTKQPNITGGATTITSANLTGSRALVSTSGGKVSTSGTTSTELTYLSGVTSAIQTQLNSKVSLTGNQSVAGIKTFTDNLNIGVSGTPRQLSINGDLLIEGNITQNGSSYETHAQQVYTTDDKITLRDGATAGLIAGATTGLTFKKYDGTNDGELSVDSSGTARVGDVGNLQPLATRDEAEAMGDGLPVVWDADDLKMITKALAPGDIPELDASKITSGTIADARIPAGITRDTELSAHTSLVNNPHAVTKAQVGLGAYPASPADIGISTATQTALDGTVKKTGNEEIDGIKTFTGEIQQKSNIDIGEDVYRAKRISRLYDINNVLVSEEVIAKLNSKEVARSIFLTNEDANGEYFTASHRIFVYEDKTYREFVLTPNGIWVQYRHLNADGTGYSNTPMRDSPGSSDAVNTKYVLDRVDEMVDYVDGDKVRKTGDTMTGALLIDTNNQYPISIRTDATYPFRIWNKTSGKSAFALYHSSDGTDPVIQMLGPNTAHRWDLTDGLIRYRGNHRLNVDPPADDNTGSLTSCRWVRARLAGKQDNLTFDDAPASGSTNPVTSNGIKVAIDAKVNRYTGSFTGDNSLKSFQITHNLNDAYPNVTVWKTSGGVTKITDVEIISTSANIITLTFAVAPTSTDSFNIKVVS